MAAPYTVRIEGAGGDHIFVKAPSVSWSFAEINLRRNTSPPVLVSLVMELSIRAEIEGATPAATVAALSTFLGAHVTKRLQPEYIQIRDALGVVVPEIGEINSAAGWEEVQLTGFRMDPSHRQLVAGAVFDLTIKGRRVFPDATLPGAEAAIVELEQTLVEGADADGLLVRTLTSTVRLSEASGLQVGALASVLRLAKPVGSVRLAPTNTSSGIQVTFTNFPLLNEGTVVSSVKVLGGGQVLPLLSGDGSPITERIEDDRASGLRRTVTSSQVSGSADPLGAVEAEQPPGTFGSTTHDLARREASGEWEGRAVLDSGLPGRIAKVRARYKLTGGGRSIAASTVGGGFLPVIRRGGSENPFFLTEEVSLVALGLEQLDEIPLPDILAEPWIHDETAQSHGLPEISEEAGSTGQLVWTRTVVRIYIWDGLVPPLEDPAQRELLLSQFAFGEAAPRTFP